jgi:hypothetical protein
MEMFKTKVAEKPKHIFMFKNVFPKIVSIMRYCGKTWLTQRGHRWQYNMAHALYMLGN